MNDFRHRFKKTFGTVLPYAIVIIVAFCFGLKFNDFNWEGKHTGGELNYSSVDQLYGVLRDNYDGTLDPQKLTDGMKKGLVEAAGDPYTTYFTEKESQEFRDSLEGKFSGIGAELGKREERLVIISPLDGFPAAKAGLKAGDAILQVNGEDAAEWSVEQAVSKIRGEKGTTVQLKIARDNQPMDFTITRDEITIPSVKSEVKDGIGYLQISRFAEDTAELSRKAAQDFKKQNVKGVVLDMRGNGGGYLEAAVDVSSLWINGKVVVEERDGDKVVDTLRGKGASVLEGVPTAVLIDGGSASASEIVAGALQDHNAATLIGAKSFGKGSVQSLEKLKSGGELKVTVARWYTPNGKNIDKEGISPNIEVKLEDADAAAGRDPQKDRAFSWVNGER